MGIILLVGETRDLNMTIGSDADYAYTLKTDSEVAVISIDDSGNIEALAEGIVFIRVTRKSDEKLMDELKIIVKPATAQPKISLDP